MLFLPPYQIQHRSDTIQIQPKKTRPGTILLSCLVINEMSIKVKQSRALVLLNQLLGIRTGIVAVAVGGAIGIVHDARRH
jgi:hypothetical protein